MAPSFLSKLVNKPGAGTRDRSFSSPSPPSRSRTPSYVDNSSGNKTNGSSMYNGSNPSVAVIPPSPVSSTLVSDTKIQDSETTPKKSESSSLERRQSSKSSKSSIQDSSVPPVPPIPIAHARAATSPAPAPAPAPAHDPDDEEHVPQSIVDSPEALRPTEFPQTSPSSSISVSTRRDTDVLSVTSQGQKKKPTSRPWRRSTPKKPMGLAGAIAASGLAMANPAMTAPHQTTLSPQVMNTNDTQSGPSLVTSPSSNPHPRRKTISPDSSGHRRHRTGSNGHGSPKDKADHQRRRTTGSVASHGEAAYFPEEQAGYYSGLDESSEEGSGSDSENESGSDLEDLDLGEDDIPVTGFAVASNKRNADFHELFPGIPEGDYLIDDYGCALQREILIQGRIYVSENHLCFHANIFGWVTDVLIPIYEITALEKKTTAFVIPNAIRVGTARGDHTFASFLSRDTTFDVIHNIWRLVRPSDAASIGSGSLEGAVANITEGTIIGAAAPGGAVQRKATQCACGKQGQHYKESAMVVVLPGTPDRIYNLMFASGFMKDFLAVNQKLLDIQVSDWTPTTPGSKLLARNMSYIKPLNGSIGPKQTKCEIRDENIHLDFDDYTSTITTTRNPDVPSGGVFSVKTRTCIMWATPLSSKVIVTTEVEWTGRSFIKGIIESSAIQGQKVYHTDLEKAMRAYITAHQTEFMPAGVDAAELAPPETTSDKAAEATDEPLSKQRERERSQRGLQWAWDTFEGASNVAVQSTKGALELIHETWEHSTWTTILYALIVVLVISNIWTYRQMGSAMKKERKKGLELAKVDDKEQWVAGVVTALFDEISAGKLPIPPVVPEVSSPPPAPSSGAEIKLELNDLLSTLDAVEERVQAIRRSLAEIQIINNLD